MKRVAVIAKLDKPEAIKIAKEIVKWLKEKGIEVYLDVGLGKRLGISKTCSRERLPSLADIIIVLGGDGTMLSAARLIADKKTPILGINLGGLGFLTAITVKEIYPVLKKVIRDDFDTEERMMLSVRIYRKNKKVSEHIALNDAVVLFPGGQIISCRKNMTRIYTHGHSLFVVDLIYYRR